MLDDELKLVLVLVVEVLVLVLLLILKLVLVVLLVIIVVVLVLVIVVELVGVVVVVIVVVNVAVLLDSKVFDSDDFILIIFSFFASSFASFSTPSSLRALFLASINASSFSLFVFSRFFFFFFSRLC